MSFSHSLVSRSLFPLRLLIFLIFLVSFGKSQKETLQVKVGVVLNTNVTLVDLSLRAINMSLSEFYKTNKDFKTRIVLHIRDSKQTVVGAAASALYLIKKKEVAAILGPGNSMQAPFIINLGNQSQVPIISFSATSPILDSLRSPYFIRAAHDDSAQVQSISAILKSFRWREAVPIYVDNEFGEGYVWIVTNGIADLMNLMGESTVEAMQGVLGVKTYFSRSKELAYLQTLWGKRFGGEELNHFGCWAYDAATALAMSVEKISEVNMTFNKTKKTMSRDDDETDLDDLATSLSGPKLLEALSTVSFKGVSGRFKLKQGKLEATTFEIINIEESGERTVGFWKSDGGLVKRLNASQSSSDLRPIIWPGDTIGVPKGWDHPISPKKLRIAVPKKDGFNQFVKVTNDANTNVPATSGFCIEVFNTVINQMPYDVPFDYVPFETPDGKSDGNYDEMVYRVFLGEYDGAVGDITILANRSAYVDFALPYSESGIVFVVPVKDEREKGEWVFLKPLTKELWLLTAFSFLYIGMMVWIFEYHADEDFRTHKMSDKISNVFYFSFSTLFFAHRKPSESFFTRALVVVWCFVLLILTQSYTATLTSMLTVQELRPTVRHMDDLKKSGVNVGYQSGSFTFERLKLMGYEESRLKAYDSPQEMRELFLNKSSDGGIDAAFDEVPYVKIFMAKYCSEYSIIEPTFKADGFGFAFPLGSPLVPDISRQILNITEGETMKRLEDKWFYGDRHCLDSTTTDTPIQLDHHSFRALFLMVFVVSVILLLLMWGIKRYKERRVEEIELVARDEVNEEGNVVDGDEADDNEHHVVDVDTALLRHKKLTSTSIPTRRATPLLRLKSA
ncbi:PREDICTED: glutamate receptor 2.5-like isoform X3 [Brassica oleracea var. oleracea]|uniref:glutamate receptor 2.5-like isoform X3 n=1 Tax=Brassica oleracea var. oleracea TaxID=109376 RepID=UPI0006A6F0F6|nr:PREDICTED: glutamate receptor 2.5-like isoform X3 [Brassica oleracea var. oleracea]